MKFCRGTFVEVPVGQHFMIEGQRGTLVKERAAADPNLDPTCNCTTRSGLSRTWCRVDPEARCRWMATEPGDTA